MGGSSPTPTPTPPPTPRPCPDSLEATLTGPAEGIVPNSWLDVVVDESGPSPRVLVVDPPTGRTVGSLAGVPRLSDLVRCILREGEEYRAFVESVEGGRVDVAVTRQA